MEDKVVERYDESVSKVYIVGDPEGTSNTNNGENPNCWSFDQQHTFKTRNSSHIKPETPVVGLMTNN